MNADEYIHFEDRARQPEAKTRIVNVRNRRSKDRLGHIGWYGPWRQYCFFPSRMTKTIFNPDCLERIAVECRTMTADHRKAKRERR